MVKCTVRLSAKSHSLYHEAAQKFNLTLAQILDCVIKKGRRLSSEQLGGLPEESPKPCYTTERVTEEKAEFMRRSDFSAIMTYVLETELKKVKKPKPLMLDSSNTPFIIVSNE